MVRYVEDAAGEGEVGYDDVGFEADTCTDAVGKCPMNNLSSRDKRKTNDSLVSRCSSSPLALT